MKKIENRSTFGEVMNNIVVPCFLTHSVYRCNSKSGIERVQALSDISRSRYVAIATQPVHRLQIRQIVHNWGHPLPFPKLHSGPCSMDMRPRTDTDRHTHTHTHRRVTTVHYFRVVYATHAKCKQDSKVRALTAAVIKCTVGLLSCKTARRNAYIK